MMLIPLLESLGDIRSPTGVGMLVGRANVTVGGGSTQHQLAGQWTNPSDVLSVLLIVGGDIVQKALAQTSGGYFTPVCFSFGWVAYSFNALVSIIGDGRLLPEPDHPAKVFNLENGYVRENSNWVIGRILRDSVMHLNEEKPVGGNAIRIAIYDAQKDQTSPSIAGTGRTRLYGITVMFLQLSIAAIPVGLYQEWGVLLVTGAGTLLALMAGALPQWRVEKNPEQKRSKKNFALTTGNGSRDIIVIRGNGKCIDLEELAAARMPRSSRIWESHTLLAKQIYEDGIPKKHANDTPYREVRTYKGIPLGFCITMTVVTIQFLLWLALLIAVAGLRSHVWFLLGVGGLGMLQNVMVAASSRKSARYGLNLRLREVITTRKVMDGLMDLEIGYDGFGDALRHEFFPGKLRFEEKEWWSGKQDAYDDARLTQIAQRGRPRRFLPKYTESIASSQVSYEKPEQSSYSPPQANIWEERRHPTAYMDAEQSAPLSSTAEIRDANLGTKEHGTPYRRDYSIDRIGIIRDIAAR